MEKIKTPPPWDAHSIEAEQALLGAILVNNAAHQFVHDVLRAEHFFEPIHRDIYEVADTLITQGKLADPRTLQAYLPGNIEVGGGLTINKYLARLAAEATTIVNARDYAMNIRDLAARRTMIELGQEMQRPVPLDISQMATDAVEVLDNLLTEQTIHTYREVGLREAVATAIDATARAYASEGAITGLSWGFTDLDNKTMGMHSDDLIVVAGRPGMGKTALMCSIARNLGRAGKPGRIESLEMNPTSLTHRLIADEMYDTRPLNYSLLRSGRFPEVTFGTITEAGKRVAEWPIVIDPKPAQTLAEIAGRARRAKRMGKLDWLMIDYLGLMKPGKRYEGNKVQEVSEITMSLKGLAKELGVPVVLLAQLSRVVETRDDKRPQLSDLRDSGSIEQDADVVLFPYRHAYYVEREQPLNARPDSEEYASWSIKMQQCMNMLDLIVAKQRSGPIGTVRLHCNIGCNAIRDLVAEDHIPERHF